MAVLSSAKRPAPQVRVQDRARKMNQFRSIFCRPFFDRKQAGLHDPKPKRTVQDMQRYLTLTELRAKLGGRSRSAIYLDLSAGRLPKPAKLGGRLYWSEVEIDAHMAKLQTEQSH